MFERNPDPDKIEKRFRESLAAFITTGRPTGDFLNAVMSNNLLEAHRRGDVMSLDNLRHICAYLYSKVPSACFGSPYIVEEWGNRAREHYKRITEKYAARPYQFSNEKPDDTGWYWIVWEPLMLPRKCFVHVTPEGIKVAVNDREEPCTLEEGTDNPDLLLFCHSWENQVV
jgi:hypothetical protein